MRMKTSLAVPSMGECRVSAKHFGHLGRIVIFAIGHLSGLSEFLWHLIKARHREASNG